MPEGAGGSAARAQPRAESPAAPLPRAPPVARLASTGWERAAAAQAAADPSPLGAERALTAAQLTAALRELPRAELLAILAAAGHTQAGGTP